MQVVQNLFISISRYRKHSIRLENNFFSLFLYEARSLHKVNMRIYKKNTHSHDLVQSKNFNAKYFRSCVLCYINLLCLSLMLENQNSLFTTYKDVSFTQYPFQPFNFKTYYFYNMKQFLL